MSQKWTQRHFPNLFAAIEQRDNDKIEQEVTKVRQFFKLDPTIDIHLFLRILHQESIVSDNLESNSLPKLLLEVNGRSLVAILDSGSDISFLSQHLAQKLKLMVALGANNRFFSLRVKGLFRVREMSFLGPILVKEMRVEGHVIAYPILVSNEFPLSIIVFGSDFLHHFGCVLDFVTRTVFLSKIDVNLCLL